VQRAGIDGLLMLKRQQIIWFFLGANLGKQGKYLEAKQFYQRAIELATSEPDEAYYNLGLILSVEYEYKGALECFQKAIKIDPEYTLAIRAREDILTLLEIIKYEIKI
jgi:tetratricopeptide (TPR) repeat protein